MSEEHKSLNQQKHQYLLRQGLKFSEGGNIFVVKCEICGSILEGWLRISKYGNAYNISTEGEFHHDSEEKIHMYCMECHERMHDWGGIQRWLDKMGKTVKDLPDARGLNPLRRGGWWR